MYRQQKNDKISLIRSLILIVALLFMCWYFSGFKGLDKVKEILHLDKKASKEIDKTPYLGTYYLESIEVENPDGTSEHYGLGDFFSKELTRESITVELKETSYSYVSRLGTIMEMNGEWESENNADTFSFYNSSDVLVFSAKITDGTFTQTHRYEGVVTTYILKKA